ncbi:MAG: sugar ABC transporter substrate-binding protein [Planctomycetota bacterium]|nr:MAG: sugar ABC transporter substrate-binding protein [Planctomycetota bacterium]REJ94634.1 MAG: sugar ABC transporter substrate-binding protein [Planctomycetota bacterium]REK22611.1 MAG: sugar ABC transporter substrate-binding protein [Planctomycetota bacterium]REK46597.1 MAG: sugar ABC transporter substrate-binding protein [Planctomycetota bacterium]
MNQQANRSQTIHSVLALLVVAATTWSATEDVSAQSSGRQRVATGADRNRIALRFADREALDPNTSSRGSELGEFEVVEPGHPLPGVVVGGRPVGHGSKHRAPKCDPADICPPVPNTFYGVHCDTCGPHCKTPKWSDAAPIPWEIFAQGEYVGPARDQHVPEYRVRVDDTLDFVYLLDRDKTAQTYRLGVGDKIRVEFLDEDQAKLFNRPPLDNAYAETTAIEIQPDGTVSLLQVGQVPAAGYTVEEFSREIEERYTEAGLRDPSVTVTPMRINTPLQDIIDSVDRRFGTGGQGLSVRVTPEGSVQLPGIDSVFVQGLTLSELRREVEQRYLDRYGNGLEVTPVLSARAPRFIFVLGEVATPGRFELEGPTTAMQAVALAGSWNVGAYLRHVVVFRRDENWRLMAMRLDLQKALFGNEPCPADEIWLRDNDIVLVPKSPILLADDAIELIFTRGIYGVVPTQYSLTFGNLDSF